MAKSLDTVTRKWSQNASAAESAFVEGVKNTTVDPTALAIAAAPAAKAGYIASIDSGQWARALGAVGKQGWQSATEAKAGNYSTGIAAGLDKYTKKMTTWLPIIQQTAAAAKAMPGTTLQQRIARSAYLATTLYNRKRA